MRFLRVRFVQKYREKRKLRYKRRAFLPFCLHKFSFFGKIAVCVKFAFVPYRLEQVILPAENDNYKINTHETKLRTH